ncbi:CLUMA_CG002917, isoform A [Clunio marinus]|uniref:CLUMA_CG002917, isoform A n=1 Tax=Clunio marinus TaxID=568069 RepID=A0A1J1HP33_9DIPT|nr:CLUMA_CG002917, isoform A [Clunio marinus]
MKKDSQIAERKPWNPPNPPPWLKVCDEAAALAAEPEAPNPPPYGLKPPPWLKDCELAAAFEADPPNPPPNPPGSLKR